MSIQSASATAAREAARSADGRFGEQVRAEPDLDLGGPPAGRTDPVEVGRGRVRHSIGDEYTTHRVRRVVEDVDCRTSVTRAVVAAETVDGSLRYLVRTQTVHDYHRGGQRLETTTSSTWGEEPTFGDFQSAQAAAREQAEGTDWGRHEPQPWAEPFAGPSRDHPEGRWLGSAVTDPSDSDGDDRYDDYTGYGSDAGADRYEKELDARW